MKISRCLTQFYANHNRRGKHCDTMEIKWTNHSHSLGFVATAQSFSHFIRLNTSTNNLMIFTHPMSVPLSIFLFRSLFGVRRKSEEREEWERRKKTYKRMTHSIANVNERERRIKKRRSVNETSTCHQIVELYQSTTTMIRKEDKHRCTRFLCFFSMRGKNLVKDQFLINKRLSVSIWYKLHIWESKVQGAEWSSALVPVVIINNPVILSKWIAVVT